jgi:hypothetical protein
LAGEATAGDEAVVVVVGATAGLTGVAGAAAAGAGVEAAGLGLPNEESPEKSKRSVEAELATIVEMDEVEVDDDVDEDDDDDEAAVLAEVAGGTNEGNLKGMSKLSSYCSSPSLLSSSSSSRFRLVTGCSN